MKTIKRDENGRKVMRVQRGTARALARSSQGYVSIPHGAFTLRIWARDAAHAQAKYTANRTQYLALDAQ